MTLPTVDLSRFTHGSDLERQQVASELLGSLSHSGFVKVVGHGIQDQVVAKMFECVRICLVSEVNNMLTLALSRSVEQVIFPNARKG